MRVSKILTVLFIAFLAASCEETKIVPIEKYKGIGYVITEKRERLSSYEYDLQLKNADTIFWITVLNFDGKDLKVGDTIK